MDSSFTHSVHLTDAHRSSRFGAEFRLLPCGQCQNLERISSTEDSEFQTRTTPFSDLEEKETAVGLDNIRTRSLPLITLEARIYLTRLLHI